MIEGIISSDSDEKKENYLKQMEAALKSAPLNFALLYQRARVLRLLDRREEAEKAYKEMLKHKWEYSQEMDIWASRGGNLRRMGKMDDGLKCYQKKDDLYDQITIKARESIDLSLDQPKAYWYKFFDKYDVLWDHKSVFEKFMAETISLNMPNTTSFINNYITKRQDNGNDWQIHYLGLSVDSNNCDNISLHLASSKRYPAFDFFGNFPPGRGSLPDDDQYLSPLDEEYLSRSSESGVIDYYKPGIYIIMTPTLEHHYPKESSTIIYIGQSMNIAKRLRTHFHGNSNQKQSMSTAIRAYYNDRKVPLLVLIDFTRKGEEPRTMEKKLLREYSNKFGDVPLINKKN